MYVIRVELPGMTAAMELGRDAKPPGGGSWYRVQGRATDGYANYEVRVEGHRIQAMLGDKSDDYGNFNVKFIFNVAYGLSRPVKAMKDGVLWLKYLRPAEDGDDSQDNPVPVPVPVPSARGDL